MQTDLTHLPEPKQRDLERIVDAVRAHLPAEMVILFGSHARGDWTEAADLNPSRWSGHASDYDILVVVADASAAADVAVLRQAEKACKDAGLSARGQLIVHDVADVNANLEEGRYFFMDIKREGRLLYDSRRFELAAPRTMTPAERRQLAQGDFDQWFGRAKGFYDIPVFAHEKGDLRMAAFNLNQATESAYKCILLVFTGYCPHEHRLGWLGEEASRFGPVFEEIFLQRAGKALERFQLLDRAYIGARYRKDFQVFWGDVEDLAPRVGALLTVAEPLCRERIEAIGQGAE